MHAQKRIFARRRVRATLNCKATRGVASFERRENPLSNHCSLVFAERGRRGFPSALHPDARDPLFPSRLTLENPRTRCTFYETSVFDAPLIT